MTARILVVDNYDSFVWNLVSYLGQIGADTTVVRNDDPLFDTPQRWQPFDGILLSPGPGRPEDAGVCVDILRGARRPIFGVCLGMQAMAVAWGGHVGRAQEQLHGKTSPIHHEGKGVFAGLPDPIVVTRYHSLAVDEVPAELDVTAHTDTGVVMGLRHRSLPIEGVQFHPESVLSQYGHQMLATWLAECGDADAPARASQMSPLMSAPGFSAPTLS